MKNNYTTILTIAGSDGSGGAGIQADLKTFAALECYGLSVITSVTAQNTVEVKEAFVLSGKQIEAQLLALISDMSIDAIKIGMPGEIGGIKTIARVIGNMKTRPPVVLDTIISSSSGQALLSAEALEPFKNELFPLATLVTPNLMEAIALTGRKLSIDSPEAVEEIAHTLNLMGAASVLVKGGHMEGSQCNDCLLHNKKIRWYSAKKIITGNTHGTGCTLSSAIAAYLGKHLLLEEAVAQAKSYTYDALEAGAAYLIGKGSGPLHHCYKLWR
ncbi:bifunctional hydroxymethylpyrimidine kinase/phosphomethylpyrimidine kinase [Chlorobium phaeobacteroides]|jgi:hydroxymethylpyrimidine/phosphomethylpyrimidine kinase|uniref:hydroxymethylpyrimidine kinase n=1 Tax=Chlorobium phaeobacteroides (strain DSM 266 / SMG 266 / 2430) TaxID=290317 RepID=A1BGM8_CHLPD|nr:bifunctional hydroxymethylpyrimidine kinase/phosphomethylpyrimidine kinase [Chlorobium phaeobacteroides]ABL65555.1 phosphomethylpyrimidine kinase [Chlorobium phaeobacteroides DSM 266]MBV5326671.1 bifunctional hydroxymethylpyrimidine kinase/phosphomethylpyrimidine kinase [Chlorobium sp.]